MYLKPFTLFLMLLHATVFAQADEYIWRPSTITMSVETDNKYMKIGQYLQLKNKLYDGEYGWTQSKIDLPDSWRIEALGFDENNLTFKNQFGETFSIKPPVLNSLDFEILDGGKKSDQELEVIWRKHALIRG
jgi:hypothetical protein